MRTSKPTISTSLQEEKDSCKPLVVFDITCSLLKSKVFPLVNGHSVFFLFVFCIQTCICLSCLASGFPN